MGVLVLSRRVGEVICLQVPGRGEVVRIEVRALSNGRAVLRFVAPDDIIIDREEIHLAKREAAKRDAEGKSAAE